MKLIYTIILIFIINNIVYSQKEDVNWIMGYAGWAGSFYGTSKISFDTILGTVPITDTISTTMDFSATNSVISDKNGNILFYTNGVVIMNRLNDTMQNGKDLSPCQYTTNFSSLGLKDLQGTLILPQPEQPKLYYLFHETIADTNVDKFLYSIIDMNGDNGKGIVTQKNIPLLNANSLSIGQITACKHANGRDWWIIKPDFYADKYYTFLLNNNGILGPFIQVFSDTSLHKRSNSSDQSGFSPDGSKYVHSEAWRSESVFLFDFDRCTGLLSNPYTISTIGLKDQYSSGCAFFSPNAKLLYISTPMFLYQYDLTATDISQTLEVIGQYDGFTSPTPVCGTTFYMGLNAPNGKIYLSATNSADRLHVINSPDSAGIACDFQQHSVQLPKIMAFGLPNFPNYRLGALQGSGCDTLTSYQSAVISEQVKVYPNPAQEQLHIEMPPEIKGEYTFTLLTMQGQTILVKNMQKLHETIFVGEMAKGMYLYRIETNKENYYGKICIE